MEPELFTTRQATSVMNIGEERARGILQAYGVQPMSLPWGTERKTLHAEAAQARAGVPKRRRPPKTLGRVIGKSAKELFAEFNMGAVQ